MKNFQIPGVRYLDLAPEAGLIASIYLTFRPSGLSAAAQNFLQLVRKQTRT